MGDEEWVWLRIPVDQVPEVVAALYGVVRELHDEIGSAADPLVLEMARNRLSRLVVTMQALRETEGRPLEA